MARTPLTPAGLRTLLGPIGAPPDPAPEVVDETACDVYVRRQIAYDVPSGRASAFVCVPTGLTGAAPLVFCHHQHHGQFDLGKSEVCGLRGDPDQAYAAELAARGFVTVAPDAIGFEDRNWADGDNVSWFELAARLVLGRTLLADCLQEISLAIDQAVALPEVDAGRIGFVGHSYGGRAALWAPLWDSRIRASVSNCGCISYRESAARDAGFQAEFVVPGFAAEYDIDDVVAADDHCSYLVTAADDDTWSRGASDLRARLLERRADHVAIETVASGHDFRPARRERAYRFLAAALATTAAEPGVAPVGGLRSVTELGISGCGG